MEGTMAPKWRHHVMRSCAFVGQLLSVLLPAALAFNVPISWGGTKSLSRRLPQQHLIHRPPLLRNHGDHHPWTQRPQRHKRIPLFSTEDSSVREVLEDSKSGLKNVDLPNSKVQEANRKNGTQLIDLAVRAQQRFQGLSESELELASRSVTKDVSNLALGAAATLGLIAATSIDGIGLPPALPLIVTFLMGYLAIVYESAVDINKSASALMMAVVCWCLVGHSTNMSPDQVLAELDKSLSGVSQIVFFLISAMAIVETVDAHEGFTVITDKIRTGDKRALLVITSVVTFFLSSILDNLTTTIVMCSLLGKLVPDEERETRQVMGGMTVIAANAGGAWSPIGDVTTTMLWINGQVTTLPLMSHLIIPSAACVAAAVGYELATMGDDDKLPDRLVTDEPLLDLPPPRGRLPVLVCGMGGLLLIPVFKSVTGLPPYAGMLVSLGILWALTDRLHGADGEGLKLPAALRRIDTAGSLFFLGILLSVGALESAGVLTQLSQGVSTVIQDPRLVATAIGIVSAIVDNVPLVAASMGMYDLTAYPADSEFWNLISYCAGTGGSMLIIGSAAGVAYMGIEAVDFSWYLKRISPAAALGYIAGVVTLVAQASIFH